MFSSLNPGHVGISASLREGLALAERHGFGGYDAQLAPLHEEVTAHGATAVRDLFLQHGLRIGAWNLPFMPYRVTEAEWRDWLAKLPPLLASARALGALRAGMWIFPGSDERSYDDNFAFHVARFKPVAQLLAEHGIRLGLEFIGPETTLRSFQHPFVRSVASILTLARAIGPNCGLLIDNRRKLPCTTGVINIDGFMQALAEAGYDGPVTAEPFDPELSALPAEEAATRTAKATRAAVARGVRSAGVGR